MNAPLGDILSLSKRLIKIPSTKENPKEIERILKVIKQELKDFPFRSFSKNGSPSLLFYNRYPKSNKFKVILNGHLDVVTGKPEQYQAKVEKDKLFGRGALDMKAEAAVLIFIFKELVQKLNYPIALQLVTDEEIGGNFGTKYQIQKGIGTEFVIAGEYTNLKVNNEAKGPKWIKVTCQGKSAHGAYLWAGENAIQKMIAFINKVNKLLPIPQKESWTTTQNLARIETTNTTVNRVPDNCAAYFDIRAIPPDSKKILEKIKAIMPKDFSLEIIEDEPCQYTEGSNPFILKLRKSIKKITGKDNGLVPFHGASDIRHFNDAGCAGVCFGPTGAGLHSDNEWVTLKSLESYYYILKDFLLHL